MSYATIANLGTRRLPATKSFDIVKFRRHVGKGGRGRGIRETVERCKCAKVGRWARRRGER
jgi:hypothetical protein